MRGVEKETKTLFEKRFSDEEKELLYDELVGIYYPEENYKEYLEKIRAVFERNKEMFSDLIAVRNLSRQPPHYYGCVKVTNLPVDKEIPWPESNHCQLKKIEKKTYVSENALTLIGMIFGEPYSMYCEGKGLVNNLIPKKCSIKDLTGLGSNSDLGFHVENAAARFLPKVDCSPKALMFMGVRQQENPPHTPITDTREALKLMAKKEIEELMSSHFRVKLPYRWRNHGENYNILTTDFIPLIEYKEGFLLTNGAFYGDMLFEPKTTEAERVAQKFKEALETVKFRPIVTPGEIIIVDNRVMYHSREPFTALFNEEGHAHRWIQRLFVTEDISRFADWDIKSDRVFAPKF
ncbi:TauD/TfdA family dioxygenase [Aureivirga sp. CE67]|uniref:TauD/TfdA family dioxygenase n=1 Tax=Aureivirga sp. CE67 TaxID=1788983 RepID=UPI0018CB88BF|nr:TauD/TfdA family dioxygenase [Aureivirga sp. CE67]